MFKRYKMNAKTDVKNTRNDMPSADYLFKAL
jgi:hypothetical protein